MLITDYKPAEQLRPFIKVYKIIESQGEIVNRVLPDTSLAVAFRYKGQTNYLLDNIKEPLPAVVISGLRRSVRLINYATDSATIVILFKETAAAAFFNFPGYELFEASTSIDNFIKPQKISGIEEQLAKADTNLQRIAIVEQFLLAQLVDHKIDKLILSALDKINSAKGLLRIKELANRLYISNDAFEKRFRKAVGTSPKQFASIVRMKTAINGKGLNQNMLNMAFDAGYFDQSHFNKEFKQFTGQSPTEFFKSASFW